MDTKHSILSELEKASPEYVSGELLSEKLGITRMAVSKAVKSLRNKGYEIESRKHYGYRLLSSSLDILDKETLLSAFGSSGIEVYYLDTTVSTNKDAKIIAQEGAVTPYVVVASSQSGGRGRLGRRFESPLGGVYFSLVLDGKDIRDSDLITIASAEAVGEVMERLTGISTSIKWVNDIYINGKKAVGILSEGIVNMEEKRLDRVVIGCGINLKTKLEDFPIELRDIVTSFYPDGEASLKRAQVIAECAKRIVEIQKEDFLENYKKKCFVIGKRVYVERKGERREADAVDLDEKGHLIVRYDDGTVDALSSGEISIRV